MSSQPSPRGRTGFTIVELLVGIVSASILALTVGSMLFYMYSGWRENAASVNMQRDGTAAADLIRRTLREASATDVSVVSGQLRIAQGATTASFAVNSGDLIFDPDIGSGGDEVTVIDNRVVTFTPTVGSAGATVRLVLQENLDQTDFSVVCAFRN